MLFLGILLFITIVFVQPQEFLPAVKGMPLVAMVMGAISAGYVCHLFASKRRETIRAHQNVLMIVFWIIIVLSTFAVHWLSYTRTIFIEWGKVVLIYFLMINIVNTQKKLTIIFWTVVFSGAILSLFGILQWHGIDVTGAGFSSDTTALRIRGIGIFDTNQLAYTMDFLSPCVFALFVLNKNFFLRIILVSIFFMYYYTVMLTDSRGGLIGAVLVVFLIFLKFNKKKIVHVVGSIIASLLFIGLLHSSSRLETITSYHSDASSMTRINVWGEALIILKESLFLGIGYNQFEERVGISPHNSYIQVVTELGLMGLFIWLAVFYYSIKNLRQIDSLNDSLEYRTQKIFAKCLQISLFVYLFSSFFNGSAYYITLYFLFALVVIVQNTTRMDSLKKQPLFLINDLLRIAIFEIALLFIIHKIV